MKRIASLLIAGLLAASPVFAADADKAPNARNEWSVWGGEAAFRWNDDLLRVLEVELVGVGASAPNDYGYRRVAARDQAALRFKVDAGCFDGFSGGSLALQGGFELRTEHGIASLKALRFVPRTDDAFLLDVVGDDGTAWFYVDRLMYEIARGPAPALHVRTMDMRVAPAFAKLVGDPTLLGQSIADVSLQARIHARDGNLSAFAAKGNSSNKWPGAPAPDGGTYQADVFMQSFTTAWKRQSSASVFPPAADGPGGNNGLVVYAPSSTLRNNRANGTSTQTIADPLGTSSAVWAADVAWWQKFTGTFDPYENDQHPYLIWNLYRTDAEGRLVQIARSGVKHAFLTTNQNCDENPGNGHILGRGCADTYSDGNNDSIGDLGPRSEIIPATGEWGRCGSVYDSDCNGSRDSGSPCQFGVANCADWSYRMQVRENEIQPTTNPGASWLMESWYIVRDDIDIFNTMQTRGQTFTWSSNRWTPNPSGALALGPAIDRWVPRDTITATQSSSSIATGDGQARVAVKVADLGGGQYRYTYAIANFDYAKAVTNGERNTHLLRVISNRGFTALRVPRAAGVVATDPVSFDGDGTDWTHAAGADAFDWTAPTGNTLDWGSLYTFSFIANAPPVAATVRLTTARTDVAEYIDAAALVPGTAGVGGFVLGGNVTGVAGSDGVELQLGNGTPLLRTVDGPYSFADTLADGSPYAVTIARQPTARNCTLSNAQGTINGANVPNINVSCVVLPPDRVTMGGTVQGLGANRSVSLSLDGAPAFVIASNGGFTFPTDAAVGANYAVQIVAQPAAQTCVLSNASGMVPAGGVSNIGVSCTDNPVSMHAVQVALDGLAAGRDIVLHLNGANPLTLTQDGDYVFGAVLASGTNYAVTVSRQPTGQQCTVSHGSGVVGSADVTDVAVACVDLPPSYAIGGTVGGLGAGQSVTLALNGGETLLRSNNGAFAFVQRLGAQAAYVVTVSASVGADCVVANGGGTVGNADITNVAVTCTTAWTGWADGFETPQ